MRKNGNDVRSMVVFGVGSELMCFDYSIKDAKI